MRLKKHLITEKTFRVNEDVKMIYNIAFKRFQKDFVNGTIPAMEQKWIVENKPFFLKEFDSSILKTKDAKAAHLVNPITINCGVLNGSYYKGKEKEMRIGFDINAARLILLGMNVPENQRTYMNNEITEAKVKSTTGHELSHWISDSMFGFQVTKIIDLAAELDSADVLKLHKLEVNMTYFEVDAVIHGIKALKSKVGNKEWDTLTFTQVGELYTSLWSVINKLKVFGAAAVAIYKKTILKRMFREKLLGKNMRKGI